jgi:hypothetical protein
MEALLHRRLMHIQRDLVAAPHGWAQHFHISNTDNRLTRIVQNTTWTNPSTTSSCFADRLVILMPTTACTLDNVLHARTATELDPYLHGLIVQAERRRATRWELFLQLHDHHSRWRPYPRDIFLHSPHSLTLMVILLYVDDFCLIASSVTQLMVMIQPTQTWCEENRLTLTASKSHVTVFLQGLDSSLVQ